MKIFSFRLVALAVLLVFAVGVRSQNSATQTQRFPQFDNEDVKVWKSVVMPNAPLTMHRHDHPRVIIALSGGIMKIVDQDGKSEEHAWETGKAYWLPANPPGTLHADVNAGDKPIEVMVVSLEKREVTQRYAAAWMPYNSAYWPPLAIKSSCEPTSTRRAPSSTTIRSAMRTVEKRWETRMVMRPPALPSRAAAA